MKDRVVPLFLAYETGRLMLRKILWIGTGLVILWLLLFGWVWGNNFYRSRQPVESIAPADTAVILGISVHDEGRQNPCLISRVEAGVELWKAGKVKKLIMSGGMNHDGYVGAQSMIQTAEKMGVPREVIELEDHSETTHQNILYTAPMIEQDKSVVIVSSAYHIPRARWIAGKLWRRKNIQTFAGKMCFENQFPRHIEELVRETGAIVKNGLLGYYW